MIKNAHPITLLLAAFIVLFQGTALNLGRGMAFDAIYLEDIEELKSLMPYVGVLSVFAGLIMALLADFILKQKWSILIGLVVMFMGSLVLFVEEPIMQFLSYVLLAVGNAMSIPAMYSLIALKYRKAGVPLLTAGFVLIYAMTTLGMGVASSLNIFQSEEKLMICSLAVISVVLSIVLSLFLKTSNEEDKGFQLPQLRFIGIAAVASFLPILYWISYEVSRSKLLSMRFEFEGVLGIEPNSIFFLTIMLGVAFALYLSAGLSMFAARRSTIISIGALLIAISLGIRATIDPSSYSGEVSMPAWFSAEFLGGWSEFFLIPICYALLTRWAPSKYITTILAASFIPIVILPIFFDLMNLSDINHQIWNVSFAFLFLMIAIGLIVYRVMDGHPKNKSAEFFGVFKDS